MARRMLILCMDGLGPEYLAASPTPNIARLAEAGSLVTGQAVIPSVTNVNNVSIVTGAPPSRHGITSNYMLDTRTGEETYMESAEFLCYPSVLQRGRALGLTTAVLTAKKKLLQLVGAGADYTLCAEEPPPDMVREIGAPGDIYSPDINLWLFQALRVVLQERDPALVYCATTDGMMHRYGPEREESVRHVQGLDALLGQIVDDNPDREVYLTADHGMTDKSWGVDIERALADEGIVARAIPIIKDRYVVHHSNLGGASYVYLQRPEQAGEALEALRLFPGIEEAYLRDEAALAFDLMAERIGDLFVLADRRTVFGTFEAARAPVSVRSHGSRYESAVPILAYGGDRRQAYQWNYDIVARLGIE
ncbi:MAG: nucleotide pyrophosphatase [Chloroflexi bacterium]|nr:nucleotide pyrophosphatase [Chloroflexota bacterium]